MCVIVSKPAGMLVHRDAKSRTFERLLLNTVRDQIGAYIHPVHRLDRNTSGIVVFALDKDTARALQTTLGDESTIKEYLALVRGVTPERFESDRPLRNEAGEPRPSRSAFRTVHQYERCALLAVRIFTGRHHQIRRHLNHLGHHVLGDTTHGKGRDNQWYRDHAGLPRMFLHAYHLEFTRPGSGDTLIITDPLPGDLREVLRRIDQREHVQTGGPASLTPPKPADRRETGISEEK